MTQLNDAQLGQLFENWTQGKSLSNEQLAALESDPTWSQRMTVQREMLNMAQTMEKDIEVPKWRKSQGFDQYLAKPSWWQTQGLSLMAFSFSIIACVIMLFDARIVQSSDGTNLVWGEQAEQNALQDQFVQLAQQNYQLINSRMDELSQIQQSNTAQLVSYVMDNSRLERKEDIDAVVRVIQQQRKDDMLYLRQQFSDVNYNIRVAAQNNLRNSRSSHLNDMPENIVAE